MRWEDYEEYQIEGILAIKCPKCKAGPGVWCGRSSRSHVVDGWVPNSTPHRERVKAAKSSSPFKSGEHVRVVSGPGTGGHGQIVKLRPEEELMSGYERGHHILTIVHRKDLFKGR